MAGNGPNAALGGIGRVLAGALKDQPWLALIAILAVVACIAAIASAAVIQSLWPLLVLLIFLMLLLIPAWAGFREQIHRQQARIVIGEPNLEGRTPMQLAHELADAVKRQIRETLAEAANATADVLGVDPGHVRANIFALDADGKLRIIPEFSHNMERPDELSVAFGPDQGVAGAAFQQRRLAFAKYEPNWGQYAIPESELAKADSRLRWIISYPVLVRQQPLWVINVDGLEDDVSEESLSVAVGKLAPWFYLIAVFLSGDSGGGGGGS